MRDVDAIAEAYPHSSDGKPMCAHCGGYRPGYLALCMNCWEALSAFTKIEFTRSRSTVEKARILLAARTRTP